MIEFRYTSGYHGLIQYAQWMLNVAAFVAIFYLLSKLFPYNFSNSVFGIIFIFIISIATVLFITFKIIKDFPENFSSFLYVRLHLRTNMSYAEVKNIAFLFDADWNGNWYPLEEVKRISKPYRRDFILEFAKMKKESKVSEKSKYHSENKTHNQQPHFSKEDIKKPPNIYHTEEWIKNLDILNLKTASTLDDIKKAYHKEIHKYHPDKVEHLGEDFKIIAERKTKAIIEAYEYFKNHFVNNL